MFALLSAIRYRRGNFLDLTPCFGQSVNQKSQLKHCRMASGFAPAMRRTGLVLVAAVVLFSALATAHAVNVGELCVEQIEEELQVNITFHCIILWVYQLM